MTFLVFYKNKGIFQSFQFVNSFLKEKIKAIIYYLAFLHKIIFSTFQLTQLDVFNRSLYLLRGCRLKLQLFHDVIGMFCSSNPDKLPTYLALLQTTRPFSVEVSFDKKVASCGAELQPDTLLHVPVILNCSRLIFKVHWKRNFRNLKFKKKVRNFRISKSLCIKFHQIPTTWYRLLRPNICREFVISGSKMCSTKQKKQISKVDVKNKGENQLQNESNPIQIYTLQKSQIHSIWGITLTKSINLNGFRLIFS